MVRKQCMGVDKLEVMAAEGEKIARLMMRKGWTFHGPEAQ